MAAALLMAATATARETYNFNAGWLMGDSRTKVTLPRAWNEDEAFRVSVYQMSDSVVWYRKDFSLPADAAGKRVFIEFEGARQAAEVWLNGHRVGLSENGVMAFGFDLTPYIRKGKNRIEVRTDNSWDYREQATGSTFQWNAKSFNANYGGLTRNVRLHIVGDVYQTLPLYSSLGTTGTYVYATQYDIPGREATVSAATEVRNDGSTPATVDYTVIVEEMDGSELARFSGGRHTLAPHSTRTLVASQRLSGLHFWSWGYGYLYRVKTVVGTDTVATTTGFRKTEFARGMIMLNDRVMQVHGYAQRSTNEWPGVGSAVPAWLSDYSNSLLVESGGNMVRWMHVTPWRQDVESCDRVGLPQALPAGDAEKTPSGRWWEQRMELMRDAIIYNRNSPSVMFYECGNRRITAEQMALMKALRNEYDPYGGRAIGSREMLDQPEAEYGGCSTSTGATPSPCGRWNTAATRVTDCTGTHGRTRSTKRAKGRCTAAIRRASTTAMPTSLPPRWCAGGTTIGASAPDRARRRGREDSVQRHADPRPLGRQLPRERRGRRHAHTQRRVLRPPGDVGLLGRRPQAAHPHSGPLEL